MVVYLFLVNFYMQHSGIAAILLRNLKLKMDVDQFARGLPVLAVEAGELTEHIHIALESDVQRCLVVMFEQIAIYQGGNWQRRACREAQDKVVTCR